MKMRVTLAALAVAGLSFGAGAATFEAQQPYQILLVDGEKTDHSVMRSVHAVDISGGKHQFALSFSKDFSTKNQIRVMHGDPVIIEVDAPADADLTISYKEPINHQAARQFLQNQAEEITVIDKRTGQPVEANIFTVYRPAGVDTARGIQEYLKETRQAFNGRTEAAVAAAQAKFGDAAVNADSLEMLQHWWNEADADTRRAFQIWMIQQQ